MPCRLLITFEFTKYVRLTPAFVGSGGSGSMTFFVQLNLCCPLDLVVSNSTSETQEKTKTFVNTIIMLLLMYVGLCYY